MLEFTGVQWLGLGVFTARDQVQSLVGELRPCKPHSTATQKRNVCVCVCVCVCVRVCVCVIIIYKLYLINLSSVQFSHSVVSVSLQPHRLQYTRLPCPSPTAEAYSSSCPLYWWCHPTISSSVIPFSRLQSFPASGSFLMYIIKYHQ